MRELTGMIVEGHMSVEEARIILIVRAQLQRKKHREQVKESRQKVKAATA